MKSRAIHSQYAKKITRCVLILQMTPKQRALYVKINFQKLIWPHVLFSSKYQVTAKNVNLKKYGQHDNVHQISFFLMIN